MGVRCAVGVLGWVWWMVRGGGGVLVIFCTTTGTQLGSLSHNLSRALFQHFTAKKHDKSTFFPQLTELFTRYTTHLSKQHWRTPPTFLALFATNLQLTAECCASPLDWSYQIFTHYFSAFAADTPFGSLGDLFQHLSTLFGWVNPEYTPKQLLHAFLWCLHNATTNQKPTRFLLFVPLGKTGELLTTFSLTPSYTVFLLSHLTPSRLTPLPTLLVSLPTPTLHPSHPASSLSKTFLHFTSTQSLPPSKQLSPNGATQTPRTYLTLNSIFQQNHQLSHQSPYPHTFTPHTNTQTHNPTHLLTQSKNPSHVFLPLPKNQPTFSVLACTFCPTSGKTYPHHPLTHTTNTKQTKPSNLMLLQRSLLPCTNYAGPLLTETLAPSLLAAHNATTPPSKNSSTITLTMNTAPAHKNKFSILGTHSTACKNFNNSSLTNTQTHYPMPMHLSKTKISPVRAQYYNHPLKRVFNLTSRAIMFLLENSSHLTHFTLPTTQHFLPQFYETLLKRTDEKL